MIAYESRAYICGHCRNTLAFEKVGTDEIVMCLNSRCPEAGNTYFAPRKPVQLRRYVVKQPTPPTGA